MTSGDTKLVLGPEETIVRSGTSEPDVATSTPSTHEWGLGAILPGEVGGLESEVLRNRLKLLELELVDALGGDEGEEDEGSEP